MKAAAFVYTWAKSADDTLGKLLVYWDRMKLLSAGRSLQPAMKLALDGGAG
jgi:hypothetical protein